MSLRWNLLINQFYYRPCFLTRLLHSHHLTVSLCWTKKLNYFFLRFYAPCIYNSCLIHLFHHMHRPINTLLGIGEFEKRSWTREDRESGEETAASRHQPKSNYLGVLKNLEPVQVVVHCMLGHIQHQPRVVRFAAGAPSIACPT